MLGHFHFYSALLAMLVGAVVVFRPKGTRKHRWLGRAYFASMLALNISALSIYQLWGHFGPFHVAALFSLITVMMGVVYAWRRKPADNWMVLHAYWISWSYVGLLAAAASETATRYLHMDFGLTVAVATGVVILGGYLVIQRHLPRLLGLKQAT